MAFRKDEQQLNVAFRGVLVDLKHNTAHLLTVQNDPVGFGFLSVEGTLYRPARNYLFSFFTTLIPHPELLLGAILECPLIFQNELFPVFGLQGNEYDFRLFHLHR